jgi:hypothetical protein
MLVLGSRTLENKKLGDQLVEWKLEIEELHDDFHTLRRNLSTKMKRLFKVVEQEGLYNATLP